jgi:hypothetical protein
MHGDQNRVGMGDGVSRRARARAASGLVGERPSHQARAEYADAHRRSFQSHTAPALSGLMTSLLVGVTPTDPLTYAPAAALIAAGALVACVVPAKRALRVDVVSALRAE